MFNSTDTYLPATIAQRAMLAASFVRECGQARIHTGITLAGGSAR
jgi:hypothetical protein